ncbi:helicase [Allostella sp. ATCC 35155]|nr:helicase [Stella sp. ATCC 35155]
MTDPILPVEGCWVVRRGSKEPLLGLVNRRLQNSQGWMLEVNWVPGGPEWVPLSDVRCGIQRGWTVQDIPVSAVRKPLGMGDTVETRLLGRREQILVQWHDTGRSTWMPYENLRRVKNPQLRLQRDEKQHADAAERFRLRMLSHALENWNQLTGSLDRLDIDPLPHQVQLVHRIVSSGHTNWLIADDVGLGKTIEVGLLLAALRRQGRARRILVVTPAGLTRQWRDEMQYKFQQLFRIYGLDFTEHDPARWKLYDQVIVSLDLAKREDHLTRLRAAGAWDIVIFDEGHRLNRHGDGERSDRYRLAEALREFADAFLLLSGTPHQGYTDRFKGLLHLIRPDLRPQIDGLEATPELVSQLILRNRKSAVTDADGNLIFQGHEVHRVPITPSPQSIWFNQRLTEYLRRGYKAGDAGGTAGRAIGFVMVIYRKLASSSVAAIEKALRTRLQKLGGQDLAGVIRSDSASIDQLLDGGDDQDTIEDDIPSSSFFDNEEALLQELIEAAQIARQSDEKLSQFLDSVVAPVVAQGKRLLIFTEYRATQSYIHEALQTRFPNHSVALINGSMGLPEKLEAIQSFRDEATFMVSTEAGGEGINLQDSCHVMVNYDLPWNPARIIQRIGRLYRYGQKSKVVVFNLHAADSFDNQSISLMLDRVATVAREMAPVGPEFGDALYAEILGELLESIDMASILQRAIGGRDSRTKEEIEEAIRDAQAAKQMQDEMLSYAAGFDPTALARSLGLGMDDVRSFISSMLPFLGVAVEAATYDGRVLHLRLPEEMRGRFREFDQRTLVRVTTDRALTLRIADVVLLDFESDFFQELVRCAQRPEFGGTYADVEFSGLPAGVLAAHRLRWQNDQGEPIVDEFRIVHADEALNVTVDPRAIGDWLRQTAQVAQSQPLNQTRRREALESIAKSANQRLGDESSRFKHPNGLVLLAAACTTGRISIR